MKVEISVESGRGRVYLDGMDISEVVGADVRIRAGEPPKVSLLLSVVGLSTRLDPEETRATIAELDKAIDLLEIEDRQDILQCLHTIRAGLGAVPKFSHLHPEFVDSSCVR